MNNVNAQSAQSRNTTSLFMNLDPDRKRRLSGVQRLFSKSSLENLLDIFLEKLVDFPLFVRKVKRDKLNAPSGPAPPKPSAGIRISVRPEKEASMDIDELKREINKPKYLDRFKKLRNKTLNKKKTRNINRLVKVFEAGLLINRDPRKCTHRAGRRDQTSRSSSTSSR